MSLHDMTGQVVGDVIVIRQDGRSSDGQAMWLVRCKCGIEKRLTGYRLRAGSSTLCAQHWRRGGLRHGLRGTSEYKAWQNMKTRCLNPRDKSFPEYGGRGIRVSVAWAQSFEQFYRDMGPRPKSDMSLDRIDVDGNYEASNCRWATEFAQQLNRRDSIR